MDKTKGLGMLGFCEDAGDGAEIWRGRRWGPEAVAQEKYRSDLEKLLAGVSVGESPGVGGAAVFMKNDVFGGGLHGLHQ
jgi:hypothetical protein